MAVRDNSIFQYFNLKPLFVGVPNSGDAQIIKNSKKLNFGIRSVL
jgi:hypothetical protein